VFALVVMGITHLLSILLVPPPLPAAGAVASMMAGPSSSSIEVQNPHPRGPAISLSCQCPPGIRTMLVIGLRNSRFSCSCPEFKKCCRGDRSRDSSILVAHWWLVVVLTMQMPGASGAPQGATGVEVADACPWLGDSIRSSLQD
jgi:hypothetical protein